MSSSQHQQQGRNNNNKFTIKSGQKTAVRLHHPLTKNHIGEVMYAHYITQTEVRFELSKSPGKCLRVTESGRVEFSPCAVDDLTSHFKFELTIQGPMYLLCKAYTDKINIAGERSWFLALSNQGQLLGNSNRGQHAQWVLVAATDPNAAAPAPQGRPGGIGNMSSSSSSGGGTQSGGGETEDDEHGMGSGGDNGYAPVNSEGDVEMNPLLGNSVSREREAQGERSIDNSHVDVENSSSSSSSSSSTAGHSHDYEHGEGTAAAAANYAAAMSMPSPADLSELALQPSDTSKQVQEKVWRWISSGYGQSFLDAKCISGKRLYTEDPSLLRSLIHRPDWPTLANRVRDWRGKHKPVYNNDLARSCMTEQKLKQFFQDGYTILPGVCSRKITDRVKKLAIYWLGLRDSTAVSTNNGRVELIGAVKTDPDVLALFYSSSLFHVAQLLIGEGDVMDPQYGEISLAFPDLTLGGGEDGDDSDSDGEGDLVNIKVKMRRRASETTGGGLKRVTGDEGEDGTSSNSSGRNNGVSWRIEGFSQADGLYDHSPHTLLMCVALSDMPASDRTQGGLTLLNVHEGSHITLMEAMKDTVARRSAIFSAPCRDTTVPGYPYTGLDAAADGDGRPNLGKATPVSIKAGDAFLCTAKLAITYGLLNPLSGESAHSCVFFRISHIDHEAGLKTLAMENVWCEFRLAESVLNPGTNAGATRVDGIDKMPHTAEQRQRDDHSELASAFMDMHATAVPAMAEASVMSYPQPPPLIPPVSTNPAATTAFPLQDANLLDLAGEDEGESGSNYSSTAAPPPVPSGQHDHDFNLL
jgi:hypothetical protein